MRSKYLFKQAWTWPKEVRSWFEERIVGTCLHVCSGRSTLGDVLVDIEPQLKGVLQGDILTRTGAFEVLGQFDTVLMDPPFNWDYPRRYNATYNLVKHLRPGGVFLQNAPWIPFHHELVDPEIWIRMPRTLNYMNMVALFKARRRSTLHSSR